jgi:hypothetical protein
MSDYNMKKESGKIFDEFLPHITLESYDDLKINKMSIPHNKTPKNSISEYDFKNKILDVLSVGNIKSKNFESSYFYIDLTNEYYTSQVIEMLKNLNLEIKTVLNDFQIIVRADPNFVYNYLEKKKKIPKKITNYIKRIDCLKGEDRLGDKLLQLMKQNSNSAKTFNISIKLIDNLSNEEETALNEIISQHIRKEINPKHFPRSKQFICGSTAKRILEISELPFIKKISVVSKIKPQGYRTGELVYSKDSYKILRNDDVPIICVLDSGTSEKFKDYCELQDPYLFDNPYDYNDHGTSVSSIALFGEDLINKKNVLEQKAKVISFKIDDSSQDEYIPLDEAVMSAIDEYKNLTNIFCLSYNYFDDIDPDERLDIVKQLDRFIQENNIILVNSCGNIDLPIAYYQRNNYPDYLSVYPVLCPSEAKNIFSVGSICRYSTLEKCIVSYHTRIGLHPIFLSNDIDKYLFFKPDVSTFGGNDELVLEKDVEGIPVIAMSPELEIGVINNRGDIVNSSGTSFSAPLIALCFARLYETYHYNNSETYKAILINKAVRGKVNNLPFFYLLDTNNITDCNDGIYLNFEAEVTPKYRSEDGSKTYTLECKTVEFYVPQEAESIDIITVHSNNHKFQDLRKFNTRLVVEVVKSNGVTAKKHSGTASQNCANTYARYTFKRDYVGIWKIKVHVETKRLPSELLKTLSVRFGISLRINMKDDCKDNFYEIYRKVFTSTIRRDNRIVKKTPSKIIGDSSQQPENLNLST